MKRSIILLTIVTLVIIGMVSFSGTALTAIPDTCCQEFYVINQGGTPVEGCTVYYGSCPKCQCVTDSTGKCKICDLTVGEQYTVGVTCPNNLSGGTTFTACADPITIIVR